MERAPTLRVDVHEPTAMADRLRALGAHVEVSSLPTGDYLTDEIVVERKCVRDLHLTLVRGRLWSQLGRLRATGRRPYLLVEGKSLDDGPLSPAAVRGTLLAVMDLGIAVLRSQSHDDSALWVFRAAVRATRARPVPNRPVYAQRPKVGGAAAEAALASIPSVSTECARNLLEHLGSVAAVAAASPEQLMTVPGIGVHRAARITETLGVTHSAYRSRRSRERRGLAT